MLTQLEMRYASLQQRVAGSLQGSIWQYVAKVTKTVISPEVQSKVVFSNFTSAALQRLVHLTKL